MADKPIGEEIWAKLKLQRKLNFEKLTVIIPIFAFCLLVCAYSIYKLSNIFYKYYQLQKTKRQEHEKKHQKGMNQLLIVENDNEVYNKDANASDLDDEYNKITQSIQNSFKDYQDYNEKLTSFYKTTRNMPAPDVIDVSVLDRNFDNY